MVGVTKHIWMTGTARYVNVVENDTDTGMVRGSYAGTIRQCVPDGCYEHTIQTPGLTQPASQMVHMESPGRPALPWGMPALLWWMLGAWDCIPLSGLNRDSSISSLSKFCIVFA